MRMRKEVDVVEDDAWCFFQRLDSGLGQGGKNERASSKKIWQGGRNWDWTGDWHGGWKN